MSRKLPTFAFFKREIFNKIREKEKNTLLYWSLFDHSTWEEIPRPSFIPTFLEGRREVFSVLDRSKNMREKYIGIGRSNRDKFYKNFVESEYLLNYLLAAQIEKRMKTERIKGEVNKNALERKRRSFPDIIVRDIKAGIINIEVKSFVGASLYDRVTTEVFKKINERSYKIKYRNFLLLLLFPIFKGDISRRIDQLTCGYYIYEKFMGGPPVKNGRRVLCQCLARGGQTYSLNKLTSRIIKYFNEVRSL